MGESFRKLEETMDSDFKNWNETLDSTSEGIKENQNTSLFENKPNRNKDSSKHIEINNKGVKNQIIKKTYFIPFCRFLSSVFCTHNVGFYIYCCISCLR